MFYVLSLSYTNICISNLIHQFSIALRARLALFVAEANSPGPSSRFRFRAELIGVLPLVPSGNDFWSYKISTIIDL